MTELGDTPRQVRLINSDTVFDGAIWNVHQDTFTLQDSDDAQPITRQYIAHTGAVAVLALTEDTKVCLVNQYRHPVGHTCWEIPAGLLDVPGESMLDAAQRELAEEAGLRAETWEVLVDQNPSGGSSSEGIRIFVATGLSDIDPSERVELEAEEAEMQVHWADITEVASAIFAGRIHNSNTVIAVLGYLAKNGAPHDVTYPTQPLDSAWMGRDGI